MAQSVHDGSSYTEQQALLRSRRPPTSSSRRTPHKSWRRNPADKIERQMHGAGFSTWGFVIYRTTYSSEEDWEEFLQRLQYRLTRTMDRWNGRDVLDAFTLTVFSDANLYDGADTSDIRAHFRRWCEQATVTERMPQQLAEPTGTAPGGAPAPLPYADDLLDQPCADTYPRYLFCIQVDEASLYSVVHDAPAPPAPDPTNLGWVKLISRNWVPIEDDPQRRPGWEAENRYEPIESITERDVGWIKVPYQAVMLEHFYGNEGMNGWRWSWRRPPDVAV